MKVVQAKTQGEICDNFLVRGQVFIIGQGISWEIEFDGLDKDCILFTAYIENIPVGAARLYQEKVGRVATIKEYRKQGVAKAVMQLIETYAKSKEMPYLKLHAQLNVKEFYQHIGYTASGDIFQEAEIDHILMTKKM